MRVLVVEESEVVRKLLVALVRELAGARDVAEAPDAVTALAFVRLRQPDVVLLRLPNGGAVNLVSELVGLSPTPVVVCLAVNPTEGLRARSLSAGAHHFFDMATQIFDAMLVVRELARGANQ